MKTASYGKWLHLLERLVGPEADDGQTEGVHGQFVVPDRLAEDVGDASGPLLPPELDMIRGIGEDLLELDAGRIGRLAQVIENDAFDLHIDERERAVFGVIGDDVVFALLVDHSSLHVAVEKVKRVRLIAFDGEAIAAEIEFRPAREVILFPAKPPECESTDFADEVWS